MEGELWQRTYDLTTVLPNQLSSQLQPKLLDSDLGVRTTVFIEDVCIGYCNIEQEVEYVLVELSAFGTAIVIERNWYPCLLPCGLCTE